MCSEASMWCVCQDACSTIPAVRRRINDISQKNTDKQITFRSFNAVKNCCHIQPKMPVIWTRMLTVLSICTRSWLSCEGFELVVGKATIVQWLVVTERVRLCVPSKWSAQDATRLPLTYPLWRFAFSTFSRANAMRRFGLTARTYSRTPGLPSS